ncbi:hypothetical protein JL2886_02249 [Phaeobacter gallaeciensis]|uniref:Uncharacterized protein n=1 Tax=Phaeobacter gallaeciensis TaxID=60890 RepID=A0A1B0ZSR5_9RHOB|nr:hypothetical protein JL2886_02249 [Phaeobacter gallaeciensis]
MKFWDIPGFEVIPIHAGWMRVKLGWNPGFACGLAKTGENHTKRP